MKITKEEINWSIVSDTKINTQSFQRLISEEEYIDFENNWIKRNGKTNGVSQMEKLLEFMGVFFMGIQNSNEDNNQYIIKNFDNLKSIFNHFQVTVFLDNVSHNFVKNLLLLNIETVEVTQSCYHNLSLWLPPSCEENKKIESLYGKLVGDIYDSVMRINELKNDKNENNLNKLITKMMPLAQTSKVMVSASMSGWRSLFKKCSEFDKDEELRWVFLKLIKDFKIRYYSFVQDLYCVDENGNTFGTDTVNSDRDAWKFLTLKEKGE